MKLTHVRIDLGEANAFVEQHHRHHQPVVGHLFSIGATLNDKIVGVVIVGRPVSRMRDDGITAEVTRLCTDGTKNACSFLYGAAARAALALGFKRIGTYILASESGVSLTATGWRMVGERGGGSWSVPSRPRVDKHPLQSKLLFERTLMMLAFVIAFVACVPARAADTCMSLPQARAAFPAKHLWWHYDAARKQCWNASPPIHRPAGQRRMIPQTAPVPVPRATVLWPSLASLAIAVDAALLTPEPATAWPLLIDVDAITADSPLADCCWPPLDDAPPFSERWTALPSNWFELIGGVK